MRNAQSNLLGKDFTSEEWGLMITVWVFHKKVEKMAQTFHAGYR